MSGLRSRPSTGGARLLSESTWPRRRGCAERPGPAAGARRSRLRGARIIITYPEKLSSEGEGRVGFDCLFGPSFSQGFLYHVAWRDGDWTFALVRDTWSNR